jgi:hypothetical protein
MKPSPAKRTKKDLSDLERLKKDLCYCCSFTKEEIELVLPHLKPPYCINTAIALIYQAKNHPDNEELLTKDAIFVPKIGMELRMYQNGCTYYGRIATEKYRARHPVTGKLTDLWDVVFSFDEEDDCPETGWDMQQLLEARASRPTQPPKEFGRPMYFLEIFSGCGIMTQKFRERKWIVNSIDRSVSSNAIHKVDIVDLIYDTHIGMLPDFLVLAPECFTYSNLAGECFTKLKL